MRLLAAAIFSLCLASGCLAAADLPHLACPHAYGAKSTAALLQKAATGMPSAQYQLGCRYLFDPGMRNMQDAYFWMHNAADTGYIDAQFMVAFMAAYGLGMEKNPESSLLWLKLAAKNGNREAKRVLGGLSFEKVLYNGKEPPRLKPLFGK